MARSKLIVHQSSAGRLTRSIPPQCFRYCSRASRLRGRIEAVLDFAKARGLRSGETPAAWRGHLALILPKRQKLARGHHAAMPYSAVPAFIGKLRERESVHALALEFLILTAARRAEVLGAKWTEIDSRREGLDRPRQPHESCRRPPRAASN